MLKLEESSQDKLIVNHSALDIDFQVKGNNYANLIRTDAAIDSVYFGASSASGTDNFFFVSGSIGTKGTSTRGTSVFGGDVVISGSITATSITTNKEMVFNEKLSGTANGTNTSFSLASTPFSTSEVSIFVNGQLQAPSGVHLYQDYSITGSTVNFTTASLPPEGSLILAIYNKAT